MRKKVKHCTLGPGDYFGEISIIYECPRTATVQCMDYSIYAQMSSNDFFDVWNYQPDIFDGFKEDLLRMYDDEWMKFKVKLLQQIDYFNHHSID